MHVRNFLVIPAFLFVCFTVAAADSAPKSAHADIVNSQGTKIGTARITPISGRGSQDCGESGTIVAGSHGIHIHAVGKCDTPDFKTAGGHFNPTNAHHGVNNAETPHPHAGDLPNLTVAANGKGSASLVAKDVTLGDGANSLFHDGGTSLVIHAKADDMMSDPSGNSGDRIACGVIEK